MCIPIYTCTCFSVDDPFIINFCAEGPRGVYIVKTVCLSYMLTAVFCFTFFMFVLLLDLLIIRF